MCSIALSSMSLGPLPGDVCIAAQHAAFVPGSVTEGIPSDGWRTRDTVVVVVVGCAVGSWIVRIWGLSVGQ